MLSKIPNWLLIILPSVLLWLAWPPMPFFPLLFVGFVPLFEISKRNAGRSGWRWFFHIYTALFLWNLLTTWWVWNSSAWGAAVMLICNPLLMVIPWALARRSSRLIGAERSNLVLIALWLLFELIHLRWELSWPWLTLGNGFAESVWFVQWYEFTGVLGGSALVLGLNLMLFRILQNGSSKAIYSFSALLLLPFILSAGLYLKPAGHADRKIKVVLLQPSFDPWNEKFVRDPGDMVQEMIQISETAVDSSTDLLVWPETSLVGTVDVTEAAMNYQVNLLERLVQKYPRLNILTGANMQHIYRNSDKRPGATARPTADPKTWYDSYNSAIFVNHNKFIQMYHKSKLVPGTEQMPLTGWFPSINDLAVKLDENSMTGSLGRSDSVVLFGRDSIIPAICYESIYGDWLARFSRAGGKLIAVITNDGWWGKTPGYRQHIAYARLRAVEQRKWVVRSANTGTSCFIDPFGKVYNATEWYEKKAIAREVVLSSGKTIYCRLGDLGVTGILLLIIAAFYLKKGRAVKG